MCPPSAGATRLWEPASSRFKTTKAESMPDCVPKDDISQEAYVYAARNLHPDILNHSLRVYLLASGLATREGSSFTSPQKNHLLFTASILHDIGTVSAHNGPQRFEVEGADCAKNLLLRHSIPETEAHDVWTAIAVHSSPGIAERISPLSRLVRLGVAMDFKRKAALKLVSGDEVREVEERFERGIIEKVLGDAVVEQALGQERNGAVGGEWEKAPAASWPGMLVRSARENPGWEGVNKAF